MPQRTLLLKKTLIISQTRSLCGLKLESLSRSDPRSKPNSKTQGSSCRRCARRLEDAQFAHSSPHASIARRWSLFKPVWKDPRKARARMRKCRHSSSPSPSGSRAKLQQDLQSHQCSLSHHKFHRKSITKTLRQEYILRILSKVRTTFQSESEA